MKEKATILVVDDEQANRRLLADLVRHEGYDVLIANGGAEALALIADKPVDLVLLDWMMPTVDGMAVLAELQKRQLLPALPVVVVTANDDRQSRLDALTAGAIDFVLKPIDRLEVACRIRTLVELKQLRDRAIATVEDKLAESDHLLRLHFAQSPVAKIVWDTSLRVVTWSPAAERLFGYTREEATGQHVAELFPGPTGSHLEGAIRSDGQDRAPGFFNEQHTRSDGEQVACEWHIAPLTSSDGACVGLSSVALDMSERTRLQGALAQSQKMDSMGQLAGGIAHDFNNILAVIISYGSLIRDAIPPGDGRRDDAIEVLKAAERGAGLTQQLLAFARQQPAEKRPTDLNQRLAQIQKLLVRTLGEHIELTVVPSARPAVVQIDPVQFDQVVLNLAVNARDAMPDGGRLRIALERVAPSSERETGWVQIKVADSGAGMDERTQRRIFEPFFTTKEQGKGTGLGLATCFGIVTEAGGTIRVQSAPGQGSTFTVELPRCAEEVGATSRTATPISRDGRGETVLVVEDDAAIRKVTARVLESAGYTVHVAVDGEEAIGRIDELGARLDVLVSDVVMPKRSGHDVVEHARRIVPGAVVLLMSGFLDSSVRSINRSDVRVLLKPLPPRELLRAIAEALASRSKSKPARAADGGAPLATQARSVSAAARPSMARSGAHPSARKDRVLVVDDDGAVAQVSKRVLEEEFEVVLVDTVAGARTALSGGAFDVLLLDVGLPDGSGLDVLRELRGNNSVLPVVMMTGTLSVETATQALRSRVNEYLPKPFATEELLRTVRDAAEAGRVSRLRAKLLAARFGGDELIKDIAGTERAFAAGLAAIRMAFQPIVRASDGSVFGYEALMRCEEPSLSSPMRLLTAAEMLGRVDDLGRAVRDGVAAAMRAERERVEAIFVNLHPAELRADLLAEATDPLLALAERVVLEVTERASLEAGPKLDHELARIRGLGYRLAVDDLGEGYAGLSSLVYLRPDIAKIDMSLVRDIHRAPLKRDIVAALVEMAQRSGIVVVAEGIETVDERDTLVDLGCDLLQGYLFARPGPPFPTPRVHFGSGSARN